MTTDYLPDRRAAVKAFALSALMTAPAAASTPAVDRTAWDAAVAAYDAALAAHDAAEIARERAVKAYRRDLPPKPPTSFVHYDHEPRSEFERKSAELKAKLDPWKAVEVACRKAHRVEELDAALNQASADISEAFETVFAMPAPDLAAVVRKMEAAVVEGVDLEDCGPVFTDLRRLGGLSA